MLSACSARPLCAYDWRYSIASFCVAAVETSPQMDALTMNAGGSRTVQLIALTCSVVIHLSDDRKHSVYF